jgi:hypothetical protein
MFTRSEDPGRSGTKVGMGKRWICRLLNHHKWVRMRRFSEEAYECRRCGERHFGKLSTRHPGLLGGEGSDGGGFGGAGDGGGDG